MCGLQSWTGELSPLVVDHWPERFLVASLELNLHQHILSDLAACDSRHVEPTSHPLISRVHTLNLPNIDDSEAKITEGITARQTQERVYMVRCLWFFVLRCPSRNHFAARVPCPVQHRIW